MTELFAATAPVFKVDGDASSELARDVSFLRIEEATDGLKTLELRLLAEGPRPNEKEEGQLYLDGQSIDFGKAIEVSIGPADAARIVFTGAVSAIEASFTNGVDAVGDGVRRGRADEAAHDAAHEDVRERQRRRHRPGHRRRARPPGRTPAPTVRPTRSCSSGTRATSRSCASARG